MARRSGPPDSLELLLDTICNTFGGVLFIAILVVLLLQQTGNSTARKVPTTNVATAADVEILTARLQQVTDDLSRLQQNRDSQQAMVQTFAPETIRQLLAERRELTQTQESLQAQVNKALASTTELAAQVDQLRLENDDVQPELDRSRHRQQSIQSEFQKEQQARVEQVRMPVTHHEFRKSEVGLVLRYGRLYVWHKYEARGATRTGLNTDEFVVISSGMFGLVTRPKPSAGIVLDESDQSRLAIHRLLGQFDPDVVVLAVIARPDSYGVFRYLRDAAISKGFEYRLMPVSANDPIRDRGGDGGTVQ